MRYFYSKLGPMIENKAALVLSVNGGPFMFYVNGFDDPRIKLGSIYPFNQFTGWLDIEAPDEPSLLPANLEASHEPVKEPAAGELPLEMPEPEVPEQREAPPEETEPLV